MSPLVCIVVILMHITGNAFYYCILYMIDLQQHSDSCEVTHPRPQSDVETPTGAENVCDVTLVLSVNVNNAPHSYSVSDFKYQICGQNNTCKETFCLCCHFVVCLKLTGVVTFNNIQR